jgi:HSP20 family protein
MARFFNGSWDPYHVLSKLQDEINRAFEWADSSRPFLAERGASFPRVNVWTTPDASVLRAEVPGVALEDLAITVEGDTLTLKGERKPAASAAPERYYRCERGYGSFGRSVRLPHRIDAEKVEAALANGVLEIRLPKAPEEKAHKITVRS